MDSIRIPVDLADIHRKLDMILENQEKMMASQAELQTEVDDLNSAVATIGAAVSSLKANLQLAQDQIAAGPNLDINALKAAVDGAQALADQLTAAVDPSQPTPPAEEIPAPVEGAPAAEPVATPAGEQTGGEGVSPEPGSGSGSGGETPPAPSVY